MASREPSFIQVGDLLVDLDRARVTRAGIEIPLPRLSFDLLMVLVDASPRVVSLDELMRRVWANLVVSPETVSQRVKLLRRALDDDPDAPRYIAGVRGRGYRLVPPVERRLTPEPAQVHGAGETPAAIATGREDAASVMRTGRLQAVRDWLGRRRTLAASGVLVAGLTLAVIVGLANKPAPNAGGPAPVASDRATVADSRPSIAVLPFANRSDQDKDAFFVDGIHDDILTQLTKVSAMKVISRTSVQRFRGTELPLSSIALQLGVNTILEGSVQRSGDRVRITVQLIDAATDTQLWAEQYDRELTAANIFAIQSEVAIAIAAALRTTLTPGQKSRINAAPTRVFAAWEAYQLGKHRIANRNSRSLREAEDFIRQAIELDPAFSLAYAELAKVLTLQVTYAGARLDDTLARAEQAAMKALALDSNLAEAWAILGLIADKRGRHDHAEAMLRRAIALNPNHVDAYNWLAGSHNMGNRAEEAFGYVQRAAELDPLSTFTSWSYAAALLGAGRFPEARRRLLSLTESDPEYAPTYVLLGLQAAYAEDRFARAVPLLARATELDPSNPVAAASLVMINFDLGDGTRHQDVIDMAERLVASEISDRTAMTAALMFLDQGDQSKAFDYARRALAANPKNRIALAILALADLAQGDHLAARNRYEKSHRSAGGAGTDHIDRSNYGWGIDFANVLLQSGETARARTLLERSEAAIDGVPRLGFFGYGIADVQILALSGDTAGALARLREAASAGWRGPFWRYYRDFDPNLASIRNEPGFKAVFADIGRDMAQQRAALAAQPQDTAIDLADGH